MSILAYSIPAFFLLLGGELLLQARTGRRLFRLNDTVSDVGLGVLSQIAGIATGLVMVGAFAWVGAQWTLQQWVPGVPDWPSAVPIVPAPSFPGLTVRVPELLSWTVAFILVDFAYYWSHRCAHEINILWAAHVVHHSSEDFNLAVAMRQSSIQSLFTWMFYMPLAALGMPWELFVTCMSVNLVYQFWIHTQAVGSLGTWTERILNTPSHHRVHHGVNPHYQDKNYGGVFIVWDRLFGTFHREEEEPVYGLTTPLRSWNPLWANIHVFVDIARAVAGARTLREAAMYVFGPPGWMPADLVDRRESPPVIRADLHEWDPEVPTLLAWYGFVQFLSALVAAAVLLYGAASLSVAHRWVSAFWVALTLTGVGGVFQTARWAGPMETWRHVALAGAAGALLAAGALPAPAALAAMAFCAVSLGWFIPQRRHLVRAEMAPIM